jgi:hypothetical protein
VITAAIALALATPLPATVEGQCVDVSDPAAELRFAGVVEEGRFPSPSTSASPEGEHAFILRLEGPICIADGGDFADPQERFERIHLWGSPQVFAALRRALGQPVEVSGRGYAAHSGHHHAPMVMQVDRVTILEK